MCQSCMESCHAGHDIGAPKHSSFFCDCGAKGVCSSLARKKTVPAPVAVTAASTVPRQPSKNARVEQLKPFRQLSSVLVVHALRSVLTDLDVLLFDAGLAAQGGAGAGAGSSAAPSGDALARHGVTVARVVKLASCIKGSSVYDLLLDAYKARAGVIFQLQCAMYDGMVSQQEISYMSAVAFIAEFQSTVCVRALEFFLCACTCLLCACVCVLICVCVCMCVHVSLGGRMC